MMIEPFSITVPRSKGRVGVRRTVSRGELDVSCRLTFAEMIVGPPGSVADLSGLTFLDSSGVGAIHRAKQIAEKDGGHLVICRPRPTVRRLFEINGLLGWLGEWDPIWSG